MRRARIACIQYQLRPIADFASFADQVGFFVESADDYDCDFVLLPELFTTQLMSFLPEREPVNAIRHLAEYTDQVVELLAGLAKRFRLHIVGGTHPRVQDGNLFNTSFFFWPDGTIGSQDKIHATPTEATYWRVTAGEQVSVFETHLGKVGIAICYDAEFPEYVRMLADAGAEILFVPYCTDDRQGYIRVRSCAQARAIENQLFVATAGTVGNLPKVQYMYTNYACSAILTPSDFPFARDGIAAEGNPNQEMILVADLDLDLLAESRARGSVRPFTDRRPHIYRRAVHTHAMPEGAVVTESKRPVATGG
ncbi:MAG: carbon-nitrogen hydrolase family protein [Myxococcota bacterium]